MTGYDALPPVLRQWVQQAALPWSARSVRRVWEKGLRDGGPEAALLRLDRAEAAMLARDRLAIGD